MILYFCKQTFVGEGDDLDMSHPPMFCTATLKTCLQ
jgi:hypothetical protein